MLRFYSLLGICFFLTHTKMYAQTSANFKVKKHSVYFAWGYNKDWFGKSTIHFKSSSQSNFEYDFKWVKVSGKDYPGFNKIFSNNISIPQYVYRVGYINTKKGWGIEYAFDHAKYIINHDKSIHMQGTVKGEYVDDYFMFDKDTMHLEHTNGANFAMINVLREKSLYQSRSNKFDITYTLKAGAGIVVPKTDVTLFGERLDNRFHVAGYIVGAEAGCSFLFYKSLYLMPSFKTAWANYTNVLTTDDARAKHHFMAYQLMLTMGYRYNF
ncbi:MAG: hypothetical protein JNK61_12440 [Bacteroidia bacterium]|nr:hypothetical protein [Bacteroidia bacterium]HQV00560.1 hypothetical protein [Bacteroidia bacterium]